MFDGARWSMNGTTVQSVAGDLDTIGQLQLYGSLDDVQLALANDAVDQGLFGVATVDDFADKMRLTANESTSRVAAHPRVSRSRRSQVFKK